MHLDRTARRVLGSLVEKRFSTPEQYPLTLNALILACNQRSNRDPFVDLEQFVVEGCVTQLRLSGFLTVVERDTGRTVRYKERLVDSLGLTEKEGAVLAELLLRGPQTEQELARRTERMRKLASPEEALQILDALAARKIVEHLPRRPGERIARWRHLMTPPDEHDADGPGPEAAAVRAVERVPASEMTTRTVEMTTRAGEMTTRAVPSFSSESATSPSAQSPSSPAPSSSPQSPPTDPFDAPTRLAMPAPHTDEIAALHVRIANMERTIDDLKSEVRGLRAAWDELRNSR
jgi:uncharacterized protein YceH (UPF0502 family)